jgi:uncharacterized membrane protein YdjX (TVP38/TMEM64 family)
MADYISLAFFVLLMNVIPAFMPPTWMILALAYIHDQSFDPLALTVVGAISSTAGRGVLSFYSGFFRTKGIKERADEIERFFRKKELELFISTFIYSLSPLPSNFIFIAKGLTGVDAISIFPAFFIGRLISYFTMIAVSNHIYVVLGAITENDLLVRALFDIMGIAGAFSFLLVDFSKLGAKSKKSSVEVKGGTKKRADAIPPSSSRGARAGS